jgi:hypothetical protein
MKVHHLIFLLLCGSCSQDIRSIASSETKNREFLRFGSEQLASFGLSNPACSVWTDWRRICSRVGESQIHCAADSTNAVQASEPFCANPYDEKPTKAQVVSRMRFCSVGYSASGASIDGANDTLCRRYQADRPFNARTISSLRTPLCAEWVEYGEQDIICQENSNSQGSCEKRSRKNEQFSSGLVCSAPIIPIGCVFDVSGVRMSSELEDGRFIILTSFYPDSRPVNALSCLSISEQVN